MSGVTTFGAAVGLGFGFIENFSVISNVLNVLFRNLLSVPIHTMAAISTSYGISRFAIKKNVAWLVVFLLLAIFVHGVFNYVMISLGFG